MKATQEKGKCYERMVPESQAKGDLGLGQIRLAANLQDLLIYTELQVCQ